MDTDRLCFGCRSHGINRRSRPRLGSNLPVNQFNDIAFAFLSPLVWMGYRSTPDQPKHEKSAKRVA